MYNTEQMHLVEINNGFIAPRHNVASSSMSATVIEGKSILSNHVILDDNLKYYEKFRYFSYHYLKRECIKVQLAQPYMLSSMRMLLLSFRGLAYGYTVEVSVNNEEWDMVADKSNESARSWQLLKFEPMLVVYIRITGIHSSNKNDKYFRCVHLEAPAPIRFLKPKQRWSISRLFDNFLPFV
ncbi:BTB/POZ domain-containing protein 9-like [Adelges cooleyi]|uniref:BTB/POZ domain-containing protein 9-like n=1 Tax=Adelges cooleyi TaxID=133065 RepID=UPI00217F5BCB|nr:BTB/POZ domain-containing protein 9-like [Adelges cooleyi]